MFVLATLIDKLDFIRRFYGITSEPFAAVLSNFTKAQESPGQFDLEGEEPPLLVGAEEAAESLNILGKSCLCLLQSAFTKYLDGFVQNYSVKPAGAGKPPSSKKRSWFEHRKDEFLVRYGIDWTKSPVDLGLIEQINLVRNDIQHGGEFYCFEHVQNPDYFKRFPLSVFAEEFSAGDPGRVVVTRDSLFAAIKAVHDHCSYLEGEWEKIAG